MPSGSGWAKTTLHVFQAGPDGDDPLTGLILDQVGNLYGSADVGAGGGGTIFQLSPSNGTWTFSTLYNFYDTGSKALPTSLIMDAVGILYGTEPVYGGPYMKGNVFKLAPGSSGWTYTSLHDFKVNRDGSSDGYEPHGSMVLDTNGNLYGTTYFGGTGSMLPRLRYRL